MSEGPCGGPLAASASTTIFMPWPLFFILPAIKLSTTGNCPSAGKHCHSARRFPPSMTCSVPSGGLQPPPAKPQPLSPVNSLANRRWLVAVQYSAFLVFLVCTEQSQCFLSSLETLLESTRMAHGCYERVCGCGWVCVCVWVGGWVCVWVGGCVACTSGLVVM